MICWIEFVRLDLLTHVLFRYHWSRRLREAASSLQRDDSIDGFSVNAVKRRAVKTVMTSALAIHVHAGGPDPSKCLGMGECPGSHDGQK